MLLVIDKIFKSMKATNVTKFKCSNPKKFWIMRSLPQLKA